MHCNIRLQPRATALKVAPRHCAQTPRLIGQALTNSRYLVVFGACLTQFTIIGFLFAYGVFIPEFQEELGWSRSLLSVAAALGTFMMGALAMVAGRLNDRFGPRRVLGFTGILYGAGIYLLSDVMQPWQLLLLFGTIIAAGLSPHDVVTLSTTARWFDKRRGVMSGVVKLGTAAGQVVVPPVTAALIIWYGWREALEILGISAAILLVFAAMFMRMPEVPAGGAQAFNIGKSFEDAKRSRVFWTICAMQFLFFPTLMSVPFHMAVHGIDLGMTKAVAATLLSVVGAASALGRIAVGTLSDGIGGKNTYSACLGILLIALLGLASISGHTPLFFVAAAYGFAHGGMFVVVSPTVARYFGMKAHGAIFGTVLFFGTVGGAGGPILLGWVFDTWGSYTPAFLTLAAMNAIAIILARTLPPPEPL